MLEGKLLYSCPNLKQRNWLAYSPLVHREMLWGVADEGWKFQDPWVSRLRLSALSCPRTVLQRWTESTDCWKQKHTEARKCVCVCACEHETWWNRDRGNRDANSGEKKRNLQDNGEGKPQEDRHANCSDCWSGSEDWEKIIQKIKMIKFLVSLNILRRALHVWGRVHS